MAQNIQENEATVTALRMHENDTGSAPVQIKDLTDRITSLTKHLQENRHDFASKRGLLIMISKRRKLLKYLRNTNVQLYNDVIQRLGLKKLK